MVVSYGHDTRWATRTVTNGVACTNQSFGDPARGVGKACYVKITHAAPSPGTSAPLPKQVPLAAANPANCSQSDGCVRYAQTRRPSLGLSPGDGAANYITKFSSTVFRLANDTGDLRTKIAPSYALVWNRGDARLSAAGRLNGHVAIAEEIGPDYVLVSQAGVGATTSLTTYPTWSMRMRINKADLKGVYCIP